jgi:hypothetical protein
VQLSVVHVHLSLKKQAHGTLPMYGQLFQVTIIIGWHLC